jgi:hypothetical protein
MQASTDKFTRETLEERGLKVHLFQFLDFKLHVSQILLEDRIFFKCLVVEVLVLLVGSLSLRDIAVLCRLFQPLRQFDVLFIKFHSLLLGLLIPLMCISPLLLTLPQGIKCFLCALLSSLGSILAPPECHPCLLQLVLQPMLVPHQRIILGKQGISLLGQVSELLVQHQDSRRCLAQDSCGAVGITHPAG